MAALAQQAALIQAALRLARLAGSLPLTKSHTTRLGRHLARLVVSAAALAARLGQSHAAPLLRLARLDI
jgi:hypothetical protein